MQRQETRTSGHKVYLNQLVKAIVLFLIILLMIFITALNYYLIERHRSHVHSELTAAFYDEAQILQDKVNYSNRVLVETVSFDTNFLNLSLKEPNIRYFDDIYSLRSTMENRINVEGIPDAWFIGFIGLDDQYYGVNRSIIDGTLAASLSKDIRKKTQSTDYSSGTFWLEEDGICFLANSSKRNSTIFYVLQKIPDYKKILKGLTGHAAYTCISVNDVEYGDEQAIDDYRTFKDYITEKNIGAKKFEYQNGSTFLTGQRINDITWLICSYHLGISDFIPTWLPLSLIIEIVLLVLVIRIYSYLKSNLFLPLYNLSERMNVIRKGGMNESAKKECKIAEIQDINDTFDLMIEEVQHQKMKAYEEVIARQQAEMQFLQLQLRPHFYFNGLKTLNALILTDKKSESLELIQNISDYLRGLMGADKNITKLKQELRFCRNYVEMQGKLTGRKLELDEAVDEGLAELPVPAFCIYTFVENSFKYARLGSTNAILQIHIQVRSFEMDQTRFLDICENDNGSGYPAEILEKLGRSEDIEDDHIGINNIRRRCRILYGNLAEFNFYNDNGAYSEIILPINIPSKKGH